MGQERANRAPQPSPALERARLLALDVDGTLTDGGIVLGWAQGASDLIELKAFDVRDGIAVRWLQDAGVRVVWITGRSGEVTRRRAQELGVDLVAQGVEDKAAELARVQAQHGVTVEETVAMGDDLPDLRLRARAGFFACPADARPEVRARADLVTAAGGGRGAVRELAEAILRAKGRWEALVASFAR